MGNRLPNRNGGEFFKGDEYWRWGWGMRYALLFPNDIVYTVGKSDWHKDWFFEEVPHATNLGFVNPAAKDPANQAFGWVNLPTAAGQDMWRDWGRGRETTWTIKFNLDHAPKGTATLRVSLGGSDSTTLTIGVNGQTAGAIRPISTNALRYNTDRGVWREYSQPFNGTFLKAGENEVTLTVPAGDLTAAFVTTICALSWTRIKPSPAPRRPVCKPVLAVSGDRAGGHIKAPVGNPSRRFPPLSPVTR